MSALWLGNSLHYSEGLNDHAVTTSKLDELGRDRRATWSREEPGCEKPLKAAICRPKDANMSSYWMACRRTHIEGSRLPVARSALTASSIVTALDR